MESVDSITQGNISSAGQRQRMIVGVVSLFAALVVLLALRQAELRRAWHLVTFPLFWLAAIGVIQAQARTGVAFAARGVCELDNGQQIKADETTAARFRARARTITTQATVAALVATGLALLMP